MCTITPVAFSTRRRLAARATRELLPEPRGQVAGIRARADLLARPRQHRARRRDRERIVDVARQLVHGGKVAQLHQWPFLDA